MKAPLECWYWMIFLMKARATVGGMVDVGGVERSGVFGFGGGGAVSVLDFGGLKTGTCCSGTGASAGVTGCSADLA